MVSFNPPDRKGLTADSDRPTPALQDKILCSPELWYPWRDRWSFIPWHGTQHTDEAQTEIDLKFHLLPLKCPKEALGPKGDNDTQGPKGYKGDTGPQGPRCDKDDIGFRRQKGDRGYANTLWTCAVMRSSKRVRSNQRHESGDEVKFNKLWPLSGG